MLQFSAAKFLGSSFSTAAPPSFLYPNTTTAKPKKTQLRIVSLDAAQSFDYETQLKSSYIKSSSLKIAIVGFGNFGQFLSKTFLSHNHTLLAYSRTDYSSIAQSLGVHFYNDPNDLFEQHPDVVLLSTSILSTEQVLFSLPLQRLKRNTLFVDVLSVKEFPRSLFIQHLPTEFDILCTHPMFGPESGKDSWGGLSFVYDKVRIGDESVRVDRCDKFLDIFKKEGCKMVEMSCAEHDRFAAGSQFVTHTMGRVLERFGLESSPINTKGYETLLDLVENTRGDSFDLYYGLFMYNKNALEQLERLDMAFEEVKKLLFGELHRIYRKQLFGDSEKERFVMQKLLGNGSPRPSEEEKEEVENPPQSAGQEHS
ncbi:hypothetical protein ACFE04_031537 [Oxalis oulophora]